MGGLTGMLGIGPNAGQQGLAFSPGAANQQQPTTSAQAGTAYNQAQSGIAGQQSFLNALQGQNGIANQSSVFNQLQGVANGTGPNPAQAQLAQATGANTANQAALMAGQRGAGANVGLMARQAAQQGGANQQAAAGQAATLQANQSLGALGQLSGIAGQQVGQQAAATGAVTNATQNEQGTLLNAIQGQNATNVQMQSNQNNVSGQLANTGAQQQGQLIGGTINGVSGALGLASGGMIPHYANGTPDATVSSIPDVTQAPPAPTGGPKSNLGKGMAAMGKSMAPAGTGGAYSAGQGIGGAIGKGLVALFGSNAPTPGITATGQAAPSDTPQPSYSAQPAAASGMSASTSGITSTAPFGMENMARGGKVPAMVSPGEGYLPPQAVDQVARGKAPLQVAQKIPGKAKVKGDSLKNDTVPKTLEEGGIVLPRSVMESKHPHWEAHKFVSAIMAKQGKLPSRGKK
jgi:hypothetical protein